MPRPIRTNICGGCRKEPKVPGQFYGKKCKAIKQREYRKRRSDELKKLIAAGLVARYGRKAKKRAARGVK